MYVKKHYKSLSLSLFSLLCDSMAQNVITHWYEEPFGMLQTNLREIDAGMDVHATADFILNNHGANAWLTTVGGILANYPTDLPFQMSNPYLDRRASGDLVQDSIDAAHSRGMRLLARMDFSKVQLPVAIEHPEWLFLSPNGTWQNHTNNLVSVCPSGEYYQERIFDILDEVTARYDLDGFFVNWASMNERDYWRVYHGVCHCESCQARWSNFTSERLPTGLDDTNYNLWREFSDGIIGDWTARVTAFIKERLPNAALILGDAADVRFHESNNAIGREYWAHATSESVSLVKSQRPDAPVLVNSAIFLDMIYRFASEEPNAYAQYFVQTIARGGNPSTYIMGPPGKIPWAGMDVAGEITTFHSRHKEIYHGMRPIAKTGLVLPDEARMNATVYEHALLEYRGLYSALQELHAPFDVVGHEYLGTMSNGTRLERYDILIVPNLGSVGANATEVLDKWVSEGGTLMVTGATGVNNNNELELQSMPASSRIKVTEQEQELWSTYFAPIQNRTEEGYYTAPIIPIIGSYYEYEWREATEELYRKLDFAPFAPPEYTYGNLQIHERGAGVGAYYDGRAILLPFPIGLGYRSTGLTSFRDFLGILLDRYGADEFLRFNCAEQVEVTLHTNGRQTVVHLVNMSGLRHQNTGPRLPIPESSILVKGDQNVTARALVSGTDLDVKDGSIFLPGFDLFEVVVIEGLP